jgi:hypothetical protein
VATTRLLDEKAYATILLSGDDLEALLAMAQRCDDESLKRSFVWRFGDALKEVRAHEAGRTCEFCGSGVSATGESVTYCRSCFYSGAPQEKALAPLIGMLETLAEVESASVWHTGGGCFVLGVERTDGAICTFVEAFRACSEERCGRPVATIRLDDEGTVEYLCPEHGSVAPRWAGGEPTLPETHDGPWVPLIARDRAAWEEWNEDAIRFDFTLPLSAVDVVRFVAEEARP